MVTTGSDIPGSQEISYTPHKQVYICTYTMVVKNDHAIGGFLNLLENPIDKISTQTCFYAFHVVFTYRANIIDTSFTLCMLFMFHITCTPAHINIHGISRLHNLGVGRYMIYMSFGLTASVM